MYEARRIGVVNEPVHKAPVINDIIHGIAGDRNIREKVGSARKIWDFHRRGRVDLAKNEMERFSELTGIVADSVEHALFLMCVMLIGSTNYNEVVSLKDEIDKAKTISISNYQRFRDVFVAEYKSDIVFRMMGIIKDYLKLYDHLYQGMIYARRGVGVNEELVASSAELRQVKMFYGECFEQLSHGFVASACLNNILSGREYDQFESMTLKKYLTINKANRCAPFSRNVSFMPLCSEYESSIRNASHHGAMKLKNNNSTIILYRSGDAGGWKEMPYAEYILRCNRITLCVARTLAFALLIV
jgi:hypothetical protein